MKRLHVHLADVADVELNPDGSIVTRESWEGSRDASFSSEHGRSSVSQAPAGSDDAAASPSKYAPRFTESGGSTDSSSLNSRERRSGGSVTTAPKPTMRDWAKKAVKSLETEIIKDQKRISFVDEIYDASLRVDDDDAEPFVSPLRRRQETSSKDIMALRAARESLEFGKENEVGDRDASADAKDAGEPSSSGADEEKEKKRPAEVGFFPPLEELSLTAMTETEKKEVADRRQSTDRRQSIDASDPDSLIPKSGVHDEVEDVWLEVFRLMRLRTWIFLDDPDSSPLAYFTSMFILGLIVTSSVTFCLETMSEFEQPEHTNAFWVIECVCIAAFTAEYLFKLFCCPDAKKFVVQPLNLVDLISILPFYIELIITSSDGGSTRIFRTVRLVRVFRVIKLGSRSGKLQVVTRTMHESLDMLAMMFFLLALTVLVFATLVYFAEKGEYFETEDVYSRDVDVECSGAALISDFITYANGTLVDGCSRVASPYKSIPDSFWWTMVTLMTVGYGDEVPVTGFGRLVACLAMLASVLLMALPISVIGSEFTQQWTEYMKHVAEISGRGRKAAPRFLEVSTQLKAHLQIVDEIMRKMRDVQTDIDERSLRVKQIVRAREKETQTLRRKALTRGKHAAAVLLVEKGEKTSSSDRLLRREVEELLNEREQLRKAAQTAELMVSAGFPETVSMCLDKCLFMSELREEDYELLIADIDDLMYRAFEWYKHRETGKKDKVRSETKRETEGGSDVGVLADVSTPKTPGRVGTVGGPPPESVGPQL